MPDPKSHGQMMNYLVRNSEDKKRMREYFETNQITTASNINKPREPKLTQMFEDFNFRNKLADGGRLGFFKGKSVSSFAEKIKELWLSGKSGKQINTDLGFKNDKSSSIEELIKSMRDPKIKVLDGNKEISISKKELKNRPDIKGKTKGGKLPYAKDPVVSKKIKDAAEAGEETISEFLRNNSDINKTSLMQFLKKTKTKWKSKGKGKPPFKKEITDDIIKVQNFLKQNPTTNIEAISRGTGISLDKIANTIVAYKKSFLESRDNFVPDKSLKNIVNKINTNFAMGFEQALDQLLIKNGINPNKVSKETRNKLLRSRRAVQEFFEGGTNFEHTLPKSLIKYIDDPEKKIELLLTGSRTSPALNQFKRRYDNLLRGAVSEYLGTAKSGVKIDLKQYNEKVNKIRQTVKDATGGYEIGYLKFNNAGKATAVLPKNSKSLLKTKGGLGPETSQKLSAFENTKYHNNLVNNYNKNPDSPIFNTLREYQSDPTKLTLFKDQQTAYEQINKYLKISKQKFLDFANENINNPAVQAIFKSPYGKGAALTTTALVPQKLAAEETQAADDVTKATGLTTGEKIAGGAAAAGTFGTKTGRNIAGRIIGGAFGPTGVGLLTGTSGGYDFTSPFDRLLLSSEAALAPELVKGTIGATKGMKNRALQKIVQRALNLGASVPTALKIARVAQPLGIMGAVTEGVVKGAKESAKESLRIDQIPDQERQLAEYDNLISNIRGYAGGGIAKEAGDPSGAMLRSMNPDSQGLRGLLKRGKKI